MDFGFRIRTPNLVRYSWQNPSYKMFVEQCIIYSLHCTVQCGLLWCATGWPIRQKTRLQGTAAGFVLGHSYVLRPEVVALKKRFYIEWCFVGDCKILCTISL